MQLILTKDLLAKIAEHLGHRLEVVTYAGEESAIECATCATVLHSQPLKRWEGGHTPR